MADRIGLDDVEQPDEDRGEADPDPTDWVWRGADPRDDSTPSAQLDVRREARRAGRGGVDVAPTRASD